ncbi:uncharacterized protein LOC111401546 isoform X2 [Olea europaea var. sylvestris]|uniref:uncharacterized protein LOC111401546 isoform X2 n=1 Tax=Olea europaea var. sylvestris TaxID=158386 RepID=UPI000C1CFB74|nr:uncharacterized protein LOC111401546 isoform X2 [Olea europaea var. sylvestris]
MLPLTRLNTSSSCNLAKPKADDRVKGLNIVTVILKSSVSPLKKVVVLSFEGCDIISQLSVASTISHGARNLALIPLLFPKIIRNTCFVRSLKHVRRLLSDEKFSYCYP